MVMGDKILRRWFCELSVQEWSIENVMAYDDINHYKKIQDPDAKKLKALYIYECFIKSGGDHELNINKIQKDTIKTRVEKGVFDDNFYDEIYQQINVNMCDTFSRLCTQKKYKDYVEKGKVTMKEKLNQKKFEIGQI